MFSFRSSRESTAPDGTVRRVQVAFTDATINLQGVDEAEFVQALDRVEAACGVRFARMAQVHGADVAVTAVPGPLAEPHDAVVTTTTGLGLMVRVADCVPILLADVAAGVVGAVHSGRPGTALDVVTAAVDTMRGQGATDLVAWIGPHVCGGCYEVPAALRDEVVAQVPGTGATTTWGTPSLDLTAGVLGQLERAGVEVLSVGGCTLEDESLHSHRRSGADAGRLAGLVWVE